MKDFKKFIVISFIIISFLLTALTVLADTESKPKTSARASALYNPETMTFLVEENATAHLPMASTTKIMTALIAIEVLDLDKDIPISNEAIGVEGSSIYLKSGDTVKARDLIYSVLLQSANDAAAALAIHISGCIDGFAELMNNKAALLNLRDTSFANPHGLDAQNHYTTARDLSLLASAALSNPIFKEICSTYAYSFYIGDSKRTITNHNKMLKLYDDTIGVKTGFTKKSGRCLVSAAQRDGITLIAVTLDDPNDWRDHTALLDYGFSMLKSYSISSLYNLDYSPKILNADQNELAIQYEDKRLVGYLNDKFNVKIDLPRYIAAPICANEQVGTIYVYKNNELYLKIPIRSTEEVFSTKQKRFSFINFKRK